MDGISAVTARIQQIENVIGSLAPRASVTSTTASGSGLAAAALAGGGLGGAGAARAGSAGIGGAAGGDFASVLAAQTASAAAPAGPSAPDPLLTPEQRANAEAVVAAGRSMGLSLRDQAIGVMTAMGESSLRVLDHGDKAGPDSRGLFQQRDNGAWGTYADRMDPTRSALSFFRALERVGARDSMTPTAVAHAVQRNADPNHYTRWWEDAVGVVSRITGASPAQIRG